MPASAFGQAEVTAAETAAATTASAAKEAAMNETCASLTVQEKLRHIREHQELGLPCPPHLRTTYIKRDGSEAPLILRPYQQQMIVHLMAIRRFVVGDDCGLGKTIESIAALCHLWKDE